MALEKLQILGSFGLQVTQNYSTYTYQRERSGFHIRTGDLRGVKTYRLVFDNAPDDYQCAVEVEDGLMLTPVQYIRRFFDEHHNPECKPFVIEDPETGLETTVVFLEHSRSATWNELKMWTTGFLLGQWESPDGFTLDAMSQPNEQMI